MFFASLLFEVAVTVSGRRLAYRYRPSHAVQAMMLAGFATAGVVYAGSIAGMNFTAPSLRAWGSIVYLVVGPSIFSYTLWYRILREVPANRVALSLFFQPVIGTFLGYFLLGETIGVETIVGELSLSEAWLGGRRAAAATVAEVSRLDLPNSQRRYRALSESDGPRAHRSRLEARGCRNARRFGETQFQIV